MDSQEMSSRIREANGFIAALDQSGGSTPKALAGYGVAPGSWADDAEMFELIHRMRCRIISSPAFNGDKVLGAILFERTMDGSVGGKSVPQTLIDRGVIPFLKVDQGLEEERDGVQLMKPISVLEPLLARAKDLGGGAEQSPFAGCKWLFPGESSASLRGFFFGPIPPRSFASAAERPRSG